MKNVNVNGVDYSGVSQVQLKTTEGGTALFKDVDEIVTPSGVKTITENGTYDVTNFATVVANIAAGGSGLLESISNFTTAEITIDEDLTGYEADVTNAILAKVEEKVTAGYGVFVILEDKATIGNQRVMTAFSVQSGALKGVNGIKRHQSSNSLTSSEVNHGGLNGALVGGTKYIVISIAVGV